VEEQLAPCASVFFARRAALRSIDVARFDAIAGGRQLFDKSWVRSDGHRACMHNEDRLHESLA
jgi:hypothetical protein